MSAESPNPTNTTSGFAPEIDASLRMPVVCLFITGALWLVAASALQLLATLKLVGPDFLAHCPCLTYGRVKPAAANAFVYGFALQVAFGVALWLICRLGRAPLANPVAVFIASKFWNIGVLLGVGGILAGDTTGHELLEMPRYAWPILFVTGTLICAWTLVALHQRREREFHVSQIFLLAALLWFPWIYSGANILLHRLHARGVLQPLVSWWFTNNLQVVCLGAIGLAAIFYFLPKAYQSPLASRDQTVIVFWTLLFFGSWCGIPAGAPVPAWLISVSVVAGFLTLVPVLTTGAMVLDVWRNSPNRTSIMRASPEMLFFSLASICFVFAGVRNALLGTRGLSEFVRYTYFNAAQSHLFLFGFFAMTMFGAIYHIAPKLMGQEWPSLGLVKLHFWTSAVGTAVIVFCFSLAGWRIGADLLQPAMPFLKAVNGQIPLLVTGMVGSVLILAGNVALLVNLFGLAARSCRMCCAGGSSPCALPTTEVAR